MKRLINLTLVALLIAAMAAPSAVAQSRSGSNSRGGSNTRPTSSRSSQSGSSQSRSTNVQSNRQQQRQPAASPSRSQQQRQPSAAPQQPARSGSNVPRSNGSVGSRPQQQRQPSARPGTVGRPSGTPPRNYAPSRVQSRPVRHSRPAPPPARRSPIQHSHSYSFRHHGPHYYGYRVTMIPSYHVRHVYWGVPYYIADNIYYRMRNGHYYVSRPPYGVVFNPVAESIVYTACKFAFYTSLINTYNTVNQNAELITQQNATIAANNALIAQQNQTIALNNQLASSSYSLANGLGLVQSYGDASLEYFYDDGVFFTRKADGSYVTMIPPAGALVQELPEDYQTKVLSDGNEYYVVDNTVFRLAVVDGEPYFEVIGQMTGSV